MMGFTGIQWGGNMHKKCIGLRKNLPEDHAVPTSNSGSVGFRFPTKHTPDICWKYSAKKGCSNQT